MGTLVELIGLHLHSCRRRRHPPWWSTYRDTSVQFSLLNWIAHLSLAQFQIVFFVVVLCVWMARRIARVLCGWRPQRSHRPSVPRILYYQFKWATSHRSTFYAVRRIRKTRSVVEIVPPATPRTPNQHPKLKLNCCVATWFSGPRRYAKNAWKKCQNQTEFVENNSKIFAFGCEAANCVLRLWCVHYNSYTFVSAACFVIRIYIRIFALLVRREPWRDPGLKTRVFSVNELKALFALSSIHRLLCTWNVRSGPEYLGSGQ